MHLQENWPKTMYLVLFCSRLCLSVHLSGDGAGAQFWALYLVCRLHTWTHSSVCFIVPVVCSSVFRGGCNRVVTMGRDHRFGQSRERCLHMLTSCGVVRELNSTFSSDSSSPGRDCWERCFSFEYYWGLKRNCDSCASLLQLKYLFKRNLFFSTSFWSV